MSNFKVVESLCTVRRYMGNKCLFFILRDCVLNTVKRLIISNTCLNNDKHQLTKLIAACANISLSLCLKGFIFVDSVLLDKISSWNSKLQRIWLIRCGHSYTAENLYCFMKCCSQLKSAILYDCPPLLFSVNKFTEISGLEIRLTKLAVGQIAEQWTNSNVILSDSAFTEEENDSEVDCMYIENLEQL